MINDKELTRTLNNFASEIKALSENDFFYAIDIIQQPYIVISGLKPEINGIPIVNNSAAIKTRDEISAYAESFLKDMRHNKKIDVTILGFAKDGLKLNEITEHLDEEYLITIVFDNAIDKNKINDLKEKYKPKILEYLYEGDLDPTRLKEEHPKIKEHRKNPVPGFGTYDSNQE